MKLVFIILNYGTYDETVECVDSIYSLIDVAKEEYKVVIVDNASPDNSGIRLRDKYINDSIVDVVINNENVGFAKGNNIGIFYAKEKYLPDFFVVLNSDTEIIQKNLYRKICEEYQESKFGVLGPMIITADGRCDVSPWEPTSYEAVKKRMKQLKRELWQIKSGVVYIKKVLFRLKRVFVKRVEISDSNHSHKDFWRRHEGVELQGAFLIFAKDAIKHIEGFDSNTFLYYEEQLLFLRLKEKGFITVYTPEIVIYHKEGRATKNNRKKQAFITKCNIESLEVLKCYMEQNNKGEENV